MCPDRTFGGGGGTSLICEDFSVALRGGCVLFLTSS